LAFAAIDREDREMVADRKGRQHQGGVTFISGVYSQFELDRCGFIEVGFAPTARRAQ
jgi:hypothetical protein